MLDNDPNRLLDSSGALAEAMPPWAPRDSLRITRVRPIVTAPGATYAGRSHNVGSANKRNTSIRSLPAVSALSPLP